MLATAIVKYLVLDKDEVNTFQSNDLLRVRKRMFDVYRRLQYRSVKQSLSKYVYVYLGLTQVTLYDFQPTV